MQFTNKFFGLKHIISAAIGHPKSAGCPVPAELISAHTGKVDHVPKVSDTSRPYDYKDRMEMRHTLGLMKSNTAKSNGRNANHFVSRFSDP